MITRDDIVHEARLWLGTPFRHQARLRGVGVDCIGVVIGVAHSLHLSDYDCRDYAASPNPKTMQALMLEHLDMIPFRSVLPGDILWFRVVHEPQHVGIVTEIGPVISMVHAYAKQSISKCVEQPLGKLWLPRICGCFRYRGI